MWRTLVIVHRYLGVAVGALMVMWFLSGIVMMYVGFPRVTETERVQTLEPITWSTCCRSDVGSIADDDPILAAWVENLGGSPALTLRRPGRPDTTLDLAHQTVVRVDAAQALSIARDAAPRVAGRPATPQFTGQVQTDQWTVGRLVRDRPLFRFELDDPARTILYVSGTDRTGGALDDGDPAFLELARRHSALALLRRIAQRCRAVERDRHLDFAARHIPDGDRTLHRHQPAQAEVEGKALALSRLVLLAPHDRARVRYRHAHLGRQRTDLDEPLGLSRKPQGRRRAEPCRGRADPMERRPRVARRNAHAAGRHRVAARGGRAVRGPPLLAGDPAGRRDRADRCRLDTPHR